MTSIINFLNSNGFQTLIALLVGVFLFIQHRINKKEELQNAAQLILVEATSAGRKISAIKQRLSERILDSDITIINNNSWQSYGHLFTRLLDRDEWDTIQSFYDQAVLLNETVKYNSEMFRNDVEQIRINKQRAAADFAINTVNGIGNDSNKESIAEQFRLKFEVYDTLYMDRQTDISYTPNRIIDDAKKYIGAMPNLMNSPALTKIKTLADKGKLRR